MFSNTAFFSSSVTSLTTLPGEPITNELSGISLFSVIKAFAKALITENKEIPDNSLVIGSPGKVVREVTEEEKKAVFENTKHYQDNWKKYSKSIF